MQERMTRKEAADYIGVHYVTMASWASTGKVKIPFHKVGAKKVIYFKSDLDAHIAAGRRTQTP